MAPPSLRERLHLLLVRLDGLGSLDVVVVASRGHEPARSGVVSVSRNKVLGEDRRDWLDALELLDLLGRQVDVERTNVVVQVLDFAPADKLR